MVFTKTRMLIYEAYFDYLPVMNAELELRGNIFFHPFLLEACILYIYIFIYIWYIYIYSVYKYIDLLLNDFVKDQFHECVYILIDGINLQYNLYEIRMIIYLSIFLVLFGILFFIFWRAKAANLGKNVIT